MTKRDSDNEIDEMLDDTSLDIIREVINIGIGDAADALSKLVRTPVFIKVPDIHIINTGDVTDYIKGEMKCLGVYMAQKFKGTINGRTLLFFTKECSISFLNAIYGDTVKTSSLNETGILTLNEVGNIIMVSCISRISDMLQSSVSLDLPEVTVEISDNYFQNLLKRMINLDKTIVIKNAMEIKERDIRGYIFVLLNFEDFSFVLDTLKNNMKI
ncbi:hypothetical protein QUF76_01485 [Desulfobacterales bacterium HSG16]|nr:hypothetical protein [Desulfobacterales bacterium HSG16]